MSEQNETLFDKGMAPKTGRVWKRNLANNFMSPQMRAIIKNGVSNYDFTGVEGAMHIDRPLTNWSLRYPNGTMIGDSVMPRIPVKNETDKYFVYGRQNFRLNKSDIRKDAADPNFVDSISYTTASYQTEEHELADLIGDRARENADPPIALDIDKQQNLTEKIMLYREKRISDLYGTLASWSTVDPLTNTVGGIDIQSSGGATKQWDYVSGATVFNSDDPAWNIEAIIDHGKQAIMSAIGKDPNVIIIPRQISRVMKKDTRLRSQIQYNPNPWNQILVDGELPDTLYNLQVFEPSCIYDSSEEGQAFSGASVWGNNIILLYLAPNPMQIKSVTAGFTFQKSPRIVKRWREEKKKADGIEVFENLVEKIVSPYCGFVIKNPIINF